jgi:hypothetical protein
VPPFPGHEADEEEEGRGLDLNLDVELPQTSWRGIEPGATPDDAPVRFIDGSIKSKTVGCLIVGGRRRPLIAAAVSAAAIEIEGRTTKRGAGTVTTKVLAVHSNGIERDDWLEAFHALQEIGVELRSSEAEANPQGDFDVLRRTTRGIAMLAMEEAERDVMLAGLPTPTLMDGLLERRLATQKLDWPVIGLVKRQMTSYLPAALQEIVYGLRPGERTPAFVMDTLQHVELVNFYMRLSSERGASPSYGIVRVTVPSAYALREHAGDLPAYLSGLAGYLYALRMRDQGYTRSGISVEPIVRCEDHLHAILPNLDALIPKLHRRLVTSG